ncbi:MAG TPA: quinone-dependent dihydroorotate dehydrogenase [Candidatus Obscuribacter sp.]|nr:quinone-dependent dihydroorotate dehydrogenase [Candidatus Obscuribacter sp.]
MDHWLLASYRQFLRPWLFLMDAEDAHNLGHKLLSAGAGVMESAAVYLGVENEVGTAALPSSWSNLSLAGRPLHNPIGLAAGFDKNGKLLDGLASLGFGFVELGSVTALATSGNPRPRLFRLPADQALINRLGLNGDGAVNVASRLKHYQGQGFPLPVALNIAKSNKPWVVQEKAAEDVAFTFKNLRHLPFTYVVINTSCPNTHEGASFAASELTMILKAVQGLNHEAARPLPIFLKLSPDSPESFLDILMPLARSFEVRGFITGNTTVSRSGLRTDAERLATIGNGGLSGAPLLTGTQTMVKEIVLRKEKEQEVIACGGISQADDVETMLKEGAKACQLYSALVYQGPFLVLALLQELKTRNQLRQSANSPAPFS